MEYIFFNKTISYSSVLNLDQIREKASELVNNTSLKNQAFYGKVEQNCFCLTPILGLNRGFKLTMKATVEQQDYPILRINYTIDIALRYLIYGIAIITIILCIIVYEKNLSVLLFGFDEGSYVLIGSFFLLFSICNFVFYNQYLRYSRILTDQLKLIRLN